MNNQGDCPLGCLKNISLERSEEIMTIAEQLIKEGVGKGILEGKRKTAKTC
ncbi:hypothetical protein SAMN05660462_00578 [Proteiniborus ethanoligenes]|uniref:Uncharacterized protein n=1 Tax=Proteiniborus ethanoligenes TaxID=415015 RepID=A0A1H3LQ36_9FIRM|nr:hypothetical protein SAMN05660462_00578 [Proteiniborus ethanoligenes]